MAEWEISLSPFYSPLDIGMRKGKRQFSSHTVTFMVTAQGRTQRPFITQGRHLLRHCSFDFLLSSLISEYSVVTPRGTPPLSIPFLSLLSSFYAVHISKKTVSVLSSKSFFPSGYSNVIHFLCHRWIYPSISNHCINYLVLFLTSRQIHSTNCDRVISLIIPFYPCCPHHTSRV